MPSRRLSKCICCSSLDAVCIGKPRSLLSILLTCDLSIAYLSPQVLLLLQEEESQVIAQVGETQAGINFIIIIAITIIIIHTLQTHTRSYTSLPFPTFLFNQTDTARDTKIHSHIRPHTQPVYTLIFSILFTSLNYLILFFYIAPSLACSLRR